MEERRSLTFLLNPTDCGSRRAKISPGTTDWKFRFNRCCVMPRSALQPLMLAVAASALTASLGFSPPEAQAASGDRIGDAVAVTNIVMANYEATQRKLARGDDVHQDETIEVDRNAEGQLRLEDETKLALGPGSRLVLDKFVYDGEKRAGSIVLNLAQGAFRFITGIALKPTYVINTPTASITVRGTIFDVYILSDNSAWLLLQEGAIEATGASNVCHVLDTPGQLIRISSGGAVSNPLNWSQLADNNSVDFDTAFPFVTNVPQVDPTQKLMREEIVGAMFPTVADKPCVNPHAPAEFHAPAIIRKADLSPPPRPMPPPEPRTGPIVTEGVYIEPPYDWHHHHRWPGHHSTDEHYPGHREPSHEHYPKPTDAKHWKPHGDSPRHAGNDSNGMGMSGMKKMHHSGDYGGMKMEGHHGGIEHGGMNMPAHHGGIGFNSFGGGGFFGRHH